MTTPASNLERRYRRLLRVLPGWYRAEREDEMVDIFLTGREDDLDREHGWPGWGETLATVALSVRTRFAVDTGPAHAVALGAVVRLIALLGLLGQAALAAGGLANGVSLLPQASLPGMATDLVGLGAAVAMAVGRRGTAKVLTALLVGSVLARMAISPSGVSSWELAFHLSLLVTAAALVAGFHQEAPTPPVAPWLRATAVAAALGALWELADNEQFVALAGGFGVLWVWAVIVVGAVSPLRRAPAAWTVALAVWAVVLLPERLLYLRLQSEIADSYPAFQHWIAPAQAAGLVLVALASGVVLLRGRQRVGVAG